MIRGESIVDAKDLCPDRDRGRILGSKVLDPRIRAGSELDPNGVTHAGLVASGNNRFFCVQGRWSPGEGHPWWGPGGDPETPYNDANKWSVICAVTDFGQREVQLAFQWPGDGRCVNIAGIDQFGVHVFFYMNDDIYGDNRSDPSNPMRYF